jgi:biotin carboxylase
MNSRHVLVVGNGRELPAQVHEIDPAATTSMLVRSSVLKRVKQPDVHARVLGLSSSEPDAWIEGARAINRIEAITHVATFSEKDQDKAAAVAAALHLRMHAPETVRAVHDKVEMRRLLGERGFPGPSAAPVTEPDDVRRFADTFGYPVVVKPVAGAASSGVSVIHDDAEVMAAWEWGKAAKEPDRADLMVEAFLDGPELSIEAFSADGRHRIVAVTEKVKDANHCVERGHVVHPFRGTPDHMQLARYTTDVLDALGVQDGVTHTEVIVTRDGPRLVETHLRPAGDEIPEMIRDCLGINLLDLLVRQSIGLDITDSLDRLDATLAGLDGTFPAIWYDNAPQSGIVRSVDGLDEARQMPGILDVTLEVEPGDAVRRVPRDSRDRVLAVKAVASDPGRALELARAAAARVRWRIDDERSGEATDPTEDSANRQPELATQHV